MIPLIVVRHVKKSYRTFPSFKSVVTSKYWKCVRFLYCTIIFTSQRYLEYWQCFISILKVKCLLFYSAKVQNKTTQHNSTHYEENFPTGSLHSYLYPIKIKSLHMIKWMC